MALSYECWHPFPPGDAVGDADVAGGQVRETALLVMACSYGRYSYGCQVRETALADGIDCEFPIVSPNRVGRRSRC